MNINYLFEYLRTLYKLKREGYSNSSPHHADAYNDIVEELDRLESAYLNQMIAPVKEKNADLN